MSGTETGTHTHHGDGRNWTSPLRVILVLFSIVGMFTLGWGAFVFAKATAASDTNIRQEEQLKAQDKEIDALKRGMDRIETKLDRVLEQKK